MHVIVDLFAAMTLAVATAAFAQFGVTVQHHAPRPPAAQQTVARVPVRSAATPRPPSARGYA